ncbi:hypothetical protein ACFWY9_12345 [Amycolatopsis sp. NPDC059027]|uniref:hypothetical protein n=1 Tax=Amycolatopsis sp. NPDC059027 TaxID=3346709 RepID=UPI00366C174A
MLAWLVEGEQWIVLDGSVLFSARSDWTLHVSPGKWPEPTERFCPPDSWFSEKILLAVGGLGFDRLLGWDEARNEVGEFWGVDLWFRGGTLGVRAGGGDYGEWRLRLSCVAGAWIDA